MANLKYSRILLKLSGESLLGDQGFGIDANAIISIAKAIKSVRDLGVEIAIVIGGGNLFRGANLVKNGLGRVSGDHMGMMATIMNGIAIRDIFLSQKIPTKVFSSLAVEGVVDVFEKQSAIEALTDKNVVIFVGGTGNPLFSTDTCASLRGIEINADIILKATKVDGVYSADPLKEKNAQRYESLSYQEVIEKNLKVMDATAICMCRDNGMPLIVFDMNKKGILETIIKGKKAGTIIGA